MTTLRFLTGLVLLAAVYPGAAAFAADKAEITLAAPAFVGGEIHLPYSMTGLFDDEIVTALESGLPATLAIEWRLIRYRPIWWDTEIDKGRSIHRILYDVLEQQYDLFDDSGRRIATSQSADDVEQVVCRDRTIVIPESTRLHSRHRYYVEVDARIEPVNVEEIRELEGWLGQEGEADGEEEALNLISGHTVQLLKDLVGLGGRTASARSERFAIRP